ncbi:MAG: FAD binding domain-containing protein [Chloroflexota bacterium]
MAVDAADLDAPEWISPTTLQEALDLRARYSDEATIVAGGTYLGILINQRFLAPSVLISLRDVHELKSLSVEGDLRIGALVTHRAVERSVDVQRGWPALAYTFSLVASPRVRNQATVGGVIADADYASDPPAMFAALNARVVVRSVGGTREIPVDQFIVSHYETLLQPDEIVTEVRVPAGVDRAVYRKFRSRSHEDRPCVAVAAARSGDTVRVAVGAVSERPQYFPEICALARGSDVTPGVAAEMAACYADAISPISDSRGSAQYRKRIIAVEVRRALEDLNDG